MLLATPAPAGAVSFAEVGPVPAGPDSVAVGDFNADSDPDLAVANGLSDKVSVLLGGAGGTGSGKDTLELAENAADRADRGAGSDRARADAGDRLRNASGSADPAGAAGNDTAHVPRLVSSSATRCCEHRAERGQHDIE